MQHLGSATGYMRILQLVHVERLTDGAASEPLEQCQRVRQTVELIGAGYSQKTVPGKAVGNRRFQWPFCDPDGVRGRISHKVNRGAGSHAAISLCTGKPYVFATLFPRMIHADLTTLQQTVYRNDGDKVSGTPRAAGQGPVLLLVLIKARNAFQATPHLQQLPCECAIPEGR